jgi:hypothetical protein
LNREDRGAARGMEDLRKIRISAFRIILSQTWSVSRWEIGW